MLPKRGERLTLSRHHLTGPIPSDLAPLTRLTNLSLYENRRSARPVAAPADPSAQHITTDPYGIVTEGDR